jgi:hypothetical protein
MDTNTTPQGNRPAYNQKRVQQLRAQISNCSKIIECEIQRLSISVVGETNADAVIGRFMFHSPSVPIEFKDFLCAYRRECERELAELHSGRSLVLMGNHVIDLDDLIDEYTSTEIPSIDPETVAALRALEPGASMIILINDTPQTIQKFS